MIWEEVIKKYGKDLAEKMGESPYLKGITLSFTKEGSLDIPESDVRLAAMWAVGKEAVVEEWD